MQFDKRFLIVGGAAVIVGALLGFVIRTFVGSSASAPQDVVKSATVSSDVVNSAVCATYEYNGTRHDLTVNEVLEMSTTYTSSVTDDGTYRVPSVETIAQVARMNIIVEEAKAKGISVTDEDMATYAKDMLGYDSIAAVAQGYGISEGNVKKVLSEAVCEQRLKEDVVGKTASFDISMPDEPTVDVSGLSEADAKKRQDEENAKKSSTYGEYVLKVVGDAWDADAGTWKDADSDYAKALKPEEFDGKLASYDAAATVYYIAYQRFAATDTDTASKWEAYVSDLMSKCSLMTYTLV